MLPDFTERRSILWKMGHGTRDISSKWLRGRISVLDISRYPELQCLLFGTWKIEVGKPSWTRMHCMFIILVYHITNRPCMPNSNHALKQRICSSCTIVQDQMAHISFNFPVQAMQMCVMQGDGQDDDVHGCNRIFFFIVPAQ